MGTTVIEGIPVSSWATGHASAATTSRPASPKASGRRHAVAAQAANRGERPPPRLAHGSASRFTRPPSFARTAGSRVSEAASTKLTASMMPRAIERKAGLGTSSTADSATSTVTPENSTALPAVSIARPTASTGPSPSSTCACLKRATTKSA